MPSDRAYLLFTLGPVQSFIEAARTLRDLWTGSYLLSWLVSQAINELLTKQPAAELIMPALNSIPDFGDRQNLRSPCLPNRFVAIVPAAQADELAAACENACRAKWLELCRTIRSQLDAQRVFPELRSWDQQVNSFFEIRTLAMPWAAATPDVLKDWGCADPLDLANTVLAAGKMRRVVPAYVPEPDDEGRYPGKCALLGSYEQMGPANFQEAKEFWNAIDLDIRGTRLKKSDRFCAIALVKRFAWAIRFRVEAGADSDDLRFLDTASVAAAPWLNDPARKNLREYAKAEGGQWLHWSSPNQGATDQEPEVRSEIWSELRSSRKESPPPAYYAVLMMDGDRMGDKQRGKDNATLQKISAALASFATGKVPGFVEDHQGQLIYAGGDDVLALLPTETAIACARTLSMAFQNHWRECGLPNGDMATVSAGLAVVHYKEDLRFALQTARASEKAAKNAGRDALTLAVCRRSGEHTSVTLPWSFCAPLQDLVERFMKGLSDRWTYRLRAELPVFQTDGPGLEAFALELRRLLGRVEALNDSEREDLRNSLGGFLRAYVDAMISGARKPTCDSLREATDKSLAGFVTVCQSASFLARGRDS